MNLGVVEKEKKRESVGLVDDRPKKMGEEICSVGTNQRTRLLFEH